MDDQAPGDAGGELRGAARQHGVGRRLVGQHQEDRVGPLEDLGGTGRHLGAGRAQGLGPGGGAVVDHERCAGVRQTQGHRLTHDTETEETDPHDAPPVRPYRARHTAGPRYDTCHSSPGYDARHRVVAPPGRAADGR